MAAICSVPYFSFTNLLPAEEIVNKHHDGIGIGAGVHNNYRKRSDTARLGSVVIAMLLSKVIEF